jgi:hypothetical protein
VYYPFFSPPAVGIDRRQTREPAELHGQAITIRR